MKARNLSLALFLSISTSLAFGADFSDKQRCGTTIVTKGWGLQAVIDACGEPLERSSYDQPYFYDDRREGPKQIQIEKVDVLKYEFYETYITTWLFRDGKLFEMYEKRK